MNRRDFLHPRRLAATAGQVLSALDAVDAPEEPGADNPSLLRVTRRAMATSFEVAIPTNASITLTGEPETPSPLVGEGRGGGEALCRHPPHPNPPPQGGREVVGRRSQPAIGLRQPTRPGLINAASAALDEVDRLEQQLSVYREDSEVCFLNRQAANEPVVVEEGLYSLLEEAARLHRETEGAFDITTGALIKAWGFYRRQQRVPPPEALASARERVGMQHVELDPQSRTVRYRRDGLEINLGSIGKGYALDCAADRLRRDWGVRTALLHGGHSSVYAMGGADVAGWAVGIRHPWNPENRLALLRLRDQGLGTSAATYQHLECQGRKLGHILDPRSGWPAEGVLSASAVAPTAAQADALATAFFILGAEKTRAYCASHPGVGAVLLLENAATPLFFGMTEGSA